MRAICVFLGAFSGNKVSYNNATKQLGLAIAESELKLVYGGGRLGLMGILADSVLQNGGKVVGVITKELYKNECHHHLNDLHIVDHMQDRKRLMSNLSDAFIAIPGGVGTLEEFFEIWNAFKLKLHNKPIGLLNTDFYFNKLIKFLDHSVKEEFVLDNIFSHLQIHQDPKVLLKMIKKRIS